MTEDTVTLRLPRDFAGQMLDGLRCREDAYQQTAEYMEGGYISDETFVCEDVTDAAEARHLAQYYRDIISCIEQQLGEQRTEHL